MQREERQPPGGTEGSSSPGRGDKRPEKAVPGSRKVTRGRVRQGPVAFTVVRGSAGRFANEQTGQQNHYWGALQSGKLCRDQGYYRQLSSAYSLIEKETETFLTVHLTP